MVEKLATSEFNILCQTGENSSQRNEKLRFDGNEFATVASTKCDHDFAGLVNYKGLVLTTGSLHSSSCYVQSELYNFDSNQWTDAPNYPFHG